MIDSSRPLRLPRIDRLAWTAVAGLFGLLFVLIALPPFVGETARGVIVDAFAPLCHQLPARSFHVAGEPWAVCHRCTGIYAGLWLSALAWAGLSEGTDSLPLEAPLLLGVALVPAAVDWAAGWAGWWTSTAALRVVTGLWFGGIAGLFATGGITELIGSLLRRTTLSFQSYTPSR